MPGPRRPVVRVTVPAKINLLLRVGPPRADGYHDLVTVLHAVDLFDEVVAAPADALTLTVTGAAHGVPTDAANLAWRAAAALAAHVGRLPQVRLRVHKAIPVAGGMAGGSADAAGALLACRALWDVDVADDELAAIGAGLGSDVPFALFGATALGTGRGERLRPVAAPALHWVLAPAATTIATAEAYRRHDRLRPDAPAPRTEDADDLLQALEAHDVRRVAELMTNDLQPAALSLVPALQDTLDRGRAAGALAGVVSGSGPTCVFLCESSEQARAVSAGLPGSLVATGPAQPHVCR